MVVKADITIDIDKQVGNLQNLTNIYNARVGDSNTPLTVLWQKNGMALNLKGLHAFIAGKVGDGSYNAETDKVDFPVGSPVVKYEDDGSGTLDDGQSGLTTLLIPKQMWTKTGLFAGYIGLKDENGSVFTSKDIFFKVLGNVLDAGVELNYFIDDFDKALAKAKGNMQQAIDDAINTYQSETKNAHDSLDALNSQIQANRDEQENLSQHLAGTEQQIAIHDIVTIPKHEADIDNISAAINQRLAQLHNGPTGIENADLLKSTYPAGADGTFLALDTNHIWIWLNNQWRDAGNYQASGLSQQAQESIENTRSAVLGNELISNSSFATGKTDPAIPHTGDTHLEVHQWSDRNWLHITSDSNSPWKGVQWNLNDSNKTYFSNPVQIEFDISSLENKSLQLYFVYFDSKGNRLATDLIDSLNLTIGKTYHYKNIFYLNQKYNNCNYVGFQIVQPDNSQIKQIIITGISAKEIYSTIESNKNLINLDDVAANAPDITALATKTINHQRWVQISSVGGQQWAGAFWSFNTVKDLPYYPIKVSFDIRGDDQPQSFSVVIKGFASDGTQITNINLPNISLDINQLAHYEQNVSLPQAEALQCTKYQLYITSIDTKPMSMVLINNVSLELQYAKNVINGNLIDFLQAQPNTPSITTLATHTTDNQRWLQISSVGGQQWAGAFWSFNTVKDLPYYPIKVSFDIRGDDKQQQFLVVIKGFDNSEKELFAANLPAVLIGSNEISHYDKSVILPQESLQCTHFQLHIASMSSNPIDGVLVSNVKLCIQPHNNNNDNLINLIDAQNKNPLVDEISIETANKKEWIHVHGSGSATWGGVQWNISNEDLSSFPVHLKFKGYSLDQSVRMLLNIKGWDKDNKLVFDKSLGTFTFTNKISSFDEIIKLPENVKNCSSIIFSVSCQDKVAFDIMINSLELYTVLDSDFIKWQYKQFHLPVINLQGDLAGISKDNFKNVTWDYYDDQQEINGFGNVKWQGNSSLNYDKKSYRLKTLKSDYKKKDKVKFKPSFSKESKFHLKAYYTDGLLSRDPVNAQIGSAILASESNLPDDIVKEDNFGFISGFPVVLFINWEYSGLYSLNTTDHFDYTKYAITGNQWNNLTKFNDTNPQVKLDGSDFESLNPDDAPTEDERKAVNDLIKFVSTSSDEDFKAHLEEHVSIDSAIDYLIFHNIIGNPDAFGKNQDLLSWDGKKWYFHSYDLDDSFQGAWNGKVTDKITYILGEKDHKLFERLGNLFADKIKQRYTDLRRWLTPDWILAKYQLRVDKIGVKNYQEEFAKWNNPAKDTEDFNQLRSAVYAQISLLDKTWMISNEDQINNLQNQINQLKNGTKK